MRQPTNTERIQAIAYARVSSKEQEKEGFSIAAQKKLLRQFASERGYELIRECVDAETAKRTGRTGFGEMLSLFKNNAAKCRVLVVEMTDRLRRNLEDYVVLDDFDLDIHLVKERKKRLIRIGGLADAATLIRKGITKDRDQCGAPAPAIK
jgi:DNA invertase Pin-like site-specific DNA recombinase